MYKRFGTPPPASPQSANKLHGTRRALWSRWSDLVHSHFSLPSSRNPASGFSPASNQSSLCPHYRPVIRLHCNIDIRPDVVLRPFCALYFSLSLPSVYLDRLICFTYWSHIYAAWKILTTKLKFANWPFSLISYLNIFVSALLDNSISECRSQQIFFNFYFTIAL